MKPAIMTLVIAIVFIIAATIIYAKVTEKMAAEMGIKPKTAEQRAEARNR